MRIRRADARYGGRHPLTQVKTAGARFRGGRELRSGANENLDGQRSSDFKYAITSAT